MKSCTNCNHECDGDMINGYHAIDTRIGKHTVTTNCVEFNKCLKCGYYELDFPRGMLVELHSILALLTNVKDLDPTVFKIARKSLGFNQAQLAVKLDIMLSIVQFHEDGLSRSRNLLDQLNSKYNTHSFDQYRMALVGLCSTAERELRHKSYGSVKG